MIFIDGNSGAPAPRPDPSTGEPRPPRAPNRIEVVPKRRSVRWARYPRAPEGRGPVLEWFQPTVGDIAVATGVTVSGLFFLGTSLLLTGFRWLRKPRAALITVGVGFGAGVTVVADSFAHSNGAFANERVSAGSDWLAVPSGWVDTYALSEVDVNDASLMPDLVLTDHSNRAIRIGLLELLSNPALWDLVYNGIVRSTRYGGVVSARARQELRLDSDTGHGAGH